MVRMVKFLRDRGADIPLVIATHSEFVLYSITRWLAKNSMRSLVKVYEFTSDGILEREVEEFGEVKVEIFSKSMKEMFFKEEIKG